MVMDVREHKSVCVSNACTLFLWMCYNYFALCGKSLICVCGHSSVISTCPDFLLLQQSFDWLAAFNPDLLQAILFIAVYLSAPVFLATCIKYCSGSLPRAFFSPPPGYCSFKNVPHKLMPNYMPYP